MPGHPLYFHYDIVGLHDLQWSTASAPRATAYDRSLHMIVVQWQLQHPTLEPSRRTSRAEHQVPEDGEVVVAGKTFQTIL